MCYPKCQPFTTHVLSSLNFSVLLPVMFYLTRLKVVIMTKIPCCFDMNHPDASYMGTVLGQSPAPIYAASSW